MAPSAASKSTSAAKPGTTAVMPPASGDGSTASHAGHVLVYFMAAVRLPLLNI